MISCNVITYADTVNNMDGLKGHHLKNCSLPSTSNRTQCHKPGRNHKTKEIEEQTLRSMSILNANALAHQTLHDKTISTSSTIKQIVSHFKTAPLVFEHHLLKELGFGVHKHRHACLNAGGSRQLSNLRPIISNVQTSDSTYPTTPPAKTKRRQKSPQRVGDYWPIQEWFGGWQIIKHPQQVNQNQPRGWFRHSIISISLLQTYPNTKLTTTCKKGCTCVFWFLELLEFHLPTVLQWFLRPKKTVTRFGQPLLRSWVSWKPLCKHAFIPHLPSVYQSYLLLPRPLLFLVLLLAASSRSQWALPDLNRELQISTGILRGREAVACRGLDPVPHRQVRRLWSRLGLEHIQNARENAQ